MSIPHDDGLRRRYFHERVKTEAQAGSLVQHDVSENTRRRLMREVASMTTYTDGFGHTGRFDDSIRVEAERVFGGSFENLELAGLSLGASQFLGLLEICVDRIFYFRQRTYDLLRLGSILMDDLPAYRIRAAAPGSAEFHVMPIGNEHLQRAVVDRTFELTRKPEFAAAQRDYAEAWKHYSRGDLDDAIVNAHKAFESAAKVVVKCLDPSSKPDQMQTNQLVPLLVQHDAIPSRLQNLVTHLTQIFMSAGALRNSAGTGHGSLDLTTPEATVALLALRLSGTLVCFLAERLDQLKPGVTSGTKQRP